MKEPDMIHPIVRLCRTALKYHLHKSVREYLTSTLVSSTSMVTIVLYDLHPYNGNEVFVNVTFQKAECPGFYANCNPSDLLGYERNYGTRAHLSSRELMSTSLYNNYHYYGNADMNAEIMQNSSVHTIWSNKTFIHNLITVEESACAIVQYFSLIDRNRWNTSCAVSFLKLRYKGENDIKVYFEYAGMIKLQMQDSALYERIIKMEAIHIGNLVDLVRPLIAYITAGNNSIFSMAIVEGPISHKLTYQLYHNVQKMLIKSNHGLKSILNIGEEIISSNSLFTIGHAMNTCYGWSYDSNFQVNNCKQRGTIRKTYDNFQTQISLLTPECEEQFSLTIIYDMHEWKAYFTGNPSVQHKLTFTGILHKEYPVNITEMHLSAIRYIFIKPGTNESNCLHRNIILNIDTKIPFRQHMTLAPTLPSTLKHAYVYWNMDHNLTWVQAESMCHSIGGYLPTITKDSDVTLFTDIILGRFLRWHEPYISICRIYTVTCSVFIGLNRQKVRLQNKVFVKLKLSFCSDKPFHLICIL